MGVMDGLKQAAVALRAADKIPEYNAILDAQHKIFDLQNENQQLKEDTWAFCPVCYEMDGQLSTLRWIESREWTADYRCNICGRSTYKGGYGQA